MIFAYVSRRAQNNSGQAAPTDPGADQLAGVGSPLPVRAGSVPHWSHRDRGGHQRSRGVRRTAAYRHCIPNTWAAGVARQRVRITRDGCRVPARRRQGRAALMFRPPSHGPIQPLLWLWFEQVGRRGTTMPLTRDSPSIQGDVPGPDPARAPLARRSPGRGSLVGGSWRGSPCQPRSAKRSAAAPASGTYLVHAPSEPSGS
jgi:hypothetical protein